MAKQPTATSVNRAMSEMQEISSAQFLAKYANGRAPRSHYLLIDGWHFPIKALWAAAHVPPVSPRSFHLRGAKAGLESLGFDRFVQRSTRPIDPNDEAIEGKSRKAEINRLSRNPALARKAKTLHRYTCMVCKFNYAEFYGDIGKEFIECHHVEPISGRAGEGEITRIDQLAVLCANCHRMAHYRAPEARTIEELKAIVAGKKKKPAAA